MFACFTELQSSHGGTGPVPGPGEGIRPLEPFPTAPGHRDRLGKPAG